MRAYHYRHAVTLDETSIAGNVYFAHYLNWQGHCREQFLADHAPGVLKALQAGELLLVTVSCSMDYYAECFAFDTIDVEMTLHGTSGNRIVIDFCFSRGGRQVARGEQTVACMRRTDGGVRPTTVPDELADALIPFT